MFRPNLLLLLWLVVVILGLLRVVVRGLKLMVTNVLWWLEYGGRWDLFLLSDVFLLARRSFIDQAKGVVIGHVDHFVTLALLPLLPFSLFPLHRVFIVILWHFYRRSGFLLRSDRFCELLLSVVVSSEREPFFTRVY